MSPVSLPLTLLAVVLAFLFVNFLLSYLLSFLTSVSNLLPSLWSCLIPRYLFLIFVVHLCISALEVLRNALYKFKTYLLTYSVFCIFYTFSVFLDEFTSFLSTALLHLMNFLPPVTYNLHLDDTCDNFSSQFLCLLSFNWTQHSVENIHLVGTINNLETSYFTQLKICYLMTTFRCRSDILITSWLFTARWSTWPGNHQEWIGMQDHTNSGTHGTRWFHRHTV